ncbi:deoxyhypusine synthase family protein [bacterium]|nr:deoxyhypusine synthase family protein [bacterium]
MQGKHPNHKKKNGARRSFTELGTGESDGLEPVLPLDLSTVTSVDDLVRGLASTAFGGRRAGEAADVLEAMARDQDCAVVLTVSGAMTIAKMGLVICDMVERGLVHAVISTGALMAHGFVEASGMTHWKHDPRMDDLELYEKGYNRVYDTLELEKNLDDAQLLVEEALSAIPEQQVLSSRLIHQELGKLLATRAKTKGGRGILRSCYERGVAVYVPAFSDSELGLDVALHNRKRRREGRPVRRFDCFEDLEHYTAWCRAQKRLAIFTIGGGTPRNWAQQVGPYVDLMAKRIGEKTELLRFHYGVRICPEPVHWGGLSGCTYSEGVSWGKFVPPEEGGRFTEVLDDATIAWPLIVRAVMERLDRRPAPKKSFAAELAPPPASEKARKKATR